MSDSILRFGKTEYTGFDILGRVTSHKQTTDGTDYTTAYVYKLAGAVIEETYPSTRKVKNTLESNGDLSMVQSVKCLDSTPGTDATCINQAGYWSYANSFTYNAAGAVTSMQLGNGRWESTTFNTRLQPTQIALGVTQGSRDLLDLDYIYGTTQNNGNVLSQTITVPRAGQSAVILNQTYSYDSLNRIKTAEEKPDGYTQTQCDQNPTHCWKQTFLFDRYGNRNFDTANGATTTLPPNFDPNIYNPTVSTSNNRFSSGQGWAYDAAGNVITDAEGRSFTYDAENKQVEVKNSNQQTIGTYYFDGDGKRVKKVVPSTGEVTVFVYDASAKLIAEYSTIVQPVNEAKVQYLTDDYLGSPRMNTDANGAVAARHDLYAYGDEISSAQRSQDLNYEGDDVRRKFTVYQRDDELDLDYARLRMYSNKHGKFMSVDPVAPDIFTPPSLNRYQYCLNNPGRFIDQGGGYDEEVHRDLTAALAFVVGFSEQQGNQIANANQWLDEEGSGASAMMAGRKGYDNRLLYHFTTEERRNQLKSAFEGQINYYGNDPLSALGTYLHAQQDSFSHEGFGPGTGQGWAFGEGFDPQHPIDSTYDGMAKYDKTNWSPEAVDKAVRMARDTLARLLTARNAMEKSGRFGKFRKPIPWETDEFINEKLWQWARTTGATPEEERNNKRNVLFEIMRYVTNYGSPSEGAGRKKPRKKKTKTSVRVVGEEE